MKKKLFLITLNTIILFCVFGIFIVTPASCLILAGSSFDVGADGWFGSGTAFSWENAGGNPGGYMQYDNNNPNYVNARITAPTEYLGNWLDLNVTDLFYDAKIFRTGSYVSRHHYKVWISGPGGKAYWNGPMVSVTATDWLTLNARITESDWTVNSGSWNSILGDVTSLQITMAYYTNWAPFEITGVDNVELFSSMEPVPEPATMLLFGTGLLGLLGFKRKKKV